MPARLLGPLGPAMPDRTAAFPGSGNPRAVALITNLHLDGWRCVSSDAPADAIDAVAPRREELLVPGGSRKTVGTCRAVVVPNEIC